MDFGSPTILADHGPPKSGLAIFQPFGSASKVEPRQSLAGREHDRSLRFEAKQNLQYPAVHFTPLQTRAIGDGFAQAVADFGLDVHTCSIMPDHVHLITGRYRNDVEYVAGFLKRAATRHLNYQKFTRCRVVDKPMDGLQAMGGRRLVRVLEFAV